MLGGKRDRLAETQAEGLGHAAGRPAPLGLVGDDQDRGLAATEDIGEMPIERRDAGPRVDEEQRQICGGQGARRLLLHPGREAALFGLFETGGIDDAKPQIGKRRLALAAVARDAGHVIHQRDALPDQAVEQCRFADIGPADDRDRETHVLPFRRSHRKAMRSALSVTT